MLGLLLGEVSERDLEAVFGKAADRRVELADAFHGSVDRDHANVSMNPLQYRFDRQPNVEVEELKVVDGKKDGLLLRRPRQVRDELIFHLRRVAADLVEGRADSGANPQKGADRPRDAFEESPPDSPSPHLPPVPFERQLLRDTDHRGLRHWPWHECHPQKRDDGARTLILVVGDIDVQVEGIRLATSQTSHQLPREERLTGARVAAYDQVPPAFIPALGQQVRKGGIHLLPAADEPDVQRTRAQALGERADRCKVNGVGPLRVGHRSCADNS